MERWTCSKGDPHCVLRHQKCPTVKIVSFTDDQEDPRINYTPVGIDIAKNVFQMHHAGRQTEEIACKPTKRAKFIDYFRNRESCPIGMEACGGAHHWERKLIQTGHQVRLMPARYVKAFNIGNKNDTANAKAIWLATQQPCKAVAIKSESADDTGVAPHA